MSARSGSSRSSRSSSAASVRSSRSALVSTPNLTLYGSPAPLAARPSSNARRACGRPPSAPPPSPPFHSHHHRTLLRCRRGGEASWEPVERDGSGYRSSATPELSDLSAMQMLRMLPVRENLSSLSCKNEVLQYPLSLKREQCSPRYISNRETFYCDINNVSGHDVPPLYLSPTGETAQKNSFSEKTFSKKKNQKIIRGYSAVPSHRPPEESFSSFLSRTKSLPSVNNFSPDSSFKFKSDMIQGFEDIDYHADVSKPGYFDENPHLRLEPVKKMESLGSNDIIPNEKNWSDGYDSKFYPFSHDNLICSSQIESEQPEIISDKKELKSFSEMQENVNNHSCSSRIEFECDVNLYKSSMQTEKLPSHTSDKKQYNPSEYKEETLQIANYKSSQFKNNSSHHVRFDVDSQEGMNSDDSVETLDLGGNFYRKHESNMDNLNIPPEQNKSSKLRDNFFPDNKLSPSKESATDNASCSSSDAHNSNFHAISKHTPSASNALSSSVFVVSNVVVNGWNSKTPTYRDGESLPCRRSTTPPSANNDKMLDTYKTSQIFVENEKNEERDGRGYNPSLVGSGIAYSNTSFSHDIKNSMESLRGPVYCVSENTLNKNFKGENPSTSYNVSETDKNLSEMGNGVTGDLICSNNDYYGNATELKIEVNDDTCNKFRKPSLCESDPGVISSLHIHTYDSRSVSRQKSEKNGGVCCNEGSFWARDIVPCSKTAPNERSEPELSNYAISEGQIKSMVLSSPAFERKDLLYKQERSLSDKDQMISQVCSPNSKCSKIEGVQSPSPDFKFSIQELRNAACYARHLATVLEGIIHKHSHTKCSSREGTSQQMDATYLSDVTWEEYSDDEWVPPDRNNVNNPVASNGFPAYSGLCSGDEKYMKELPEEKIPPRINESANTIKQLSKNNGTSSIEREDNGQMLFSPQERVTVNHECNNIEGKMGDNKYVGNKKTQNLTTITSCSSPSSDTCHCCGPRILNLTPEQLRMQRASLKTPSTKEKQGQSFPLVQQSLHQEVTNALRNALQLRRDAFLPSDDTTCATSRSMSEWSV